MPKKPSSSVQDLDDPPASSHRTKLVSMLKKRHEKNKKKEALSEFPGVQRTSEDELNEDLPEAFAPVQDPPHPVLDPPDVSEAGADAGAGTGTSPGAPAKGDVRERQAAPAKTHAGDPVEQLAEEPADDVPAQVHPTGASTSDNAGN